MATTKTAWASETSEDKARIQKRAMESRRVTVTPKIYDCAWCSTGPRREPELLLVNFKYAAVPSFTQIA